MRTLRIGLFLLVLLAACSTGAATTVPATTAASDETVEFKKALLRVEINATDGDAGLQIDLDHEPWKALSLIAPDGRKILDVTNLGVLESYGLTELFSESSEPPFTEFPLDEFKQLFPEGEYLFEGEQIDGVRMRSTFTLSHAFPDGPEILSPQEDATVGAEALVVEWALADQPAGVEVVRFQILVINEADDRFQFSATVPADVSSITVPVEFLAVFGDYKVEVLAIDASGNQTLSEVAFVVG